MIPHKRYIYGKINDPPDVCFASVFPLRSSTLSREMRALKHIITVVRAYG